MSISLARLDRYCTQLGVMTANVVPSCFQICHIFFNKTETSIKNNLLSWRKEDPILLHPCQGGFLSARKVSNIAHTLNMVHRWQNYGINDGRLSVSTWRRWHVKTQRLSSRLFLMRPNNGLLANKRARILINSTKEYWVRLGEAKLWAVEISFAKAWILDIWCGRLPELCVHYLWFLLQLGQLSSRIVPEGESRVIR